VSLLRQLHTAEALRSRVAKAVKSALDVLAPVAAADAAARCGPLSGAALLEALATEASMSLTDAGSGEWFLSCNEYYVAVKLSAAGAPVAAEVCNTYDGIPVHDAALTKLVLSLDVPLIAAALRRHSVVRGRECAWV
jgi:hypothetical protein